MGRLLTLLATTSAITPTYNKSFATSLPAEWTYTRADTTATYTDANGKVQVSTTDTSRPYYVSGVRYGIWHEITRTNKMTCIKKNPGSGVLTNLTMSGDVAAVLSTVDDTAALATAGLDAICSNNLVYDIDNTLGVTNATCTIGGTCGNTNPHSFSMYGRSTTGAIITVQTTSSAGTLSFSSAAYTRLQSNNVTIDNAARQIRIVVAAGRRFRFTLPQLEEGSNSTTPIVNETAATCARAQESVYLADATPYTTVAQGAIVADVYYPNILTNTVGTAFFFGSGTDVNFDDCIASSSVAGATRKKTISRLYAGSAQQLATDVGSIDAINNRYSHAATWSNGVTATAATGAVSYQTFAIGTVAALGRLWLGGRSTSDSINGCLAGVKLFNRKLTPSQLGKYMVLAGDFVVPGFGQSNQTGPFSAQSGANNTGEVSGKAVIDAVWTSTRNHIANCGTTGTSLLYYEGTSGADDWWYNKDTGAQGTPLLRAIEIVKGCGNGTFKAAWFVNGESDAGLCTKTEYKNAMIAVLALLRTAANSAALKAIVQPIGYNTSVLNGYQTIREAQIELCTENPTDFYRAPERFDLALSDAVHLTDASNGTMMTRIMRKLAKVLGETITGGVDGPAITNATRIGTAVTVTLAHDTGTDFTPTSAIAGFEYFNGSDYNAAANVITAAVRTNATTITLTLTTSSAGTLYYGKGSLSTQTQANVVKDNATVSLPLKSSVWTVA